MVCVCVGGGGGGGRGGCLRSNYYTRFKISGEKQKIRSNEKFNLL